MFVAIITCAVAACGLTGSFTSHRLHASPADCMQQTMAALQMIGENPSSFKIVCKRK